jgi:hypothetical protein
MMESSTDHDRAWIEALAAAIAHSPIVVPRPATRLPAGFDAVDRAILEWIAAEARQLRGFALI